MIGIAAFYVIDAQKVTFIKYRPDTFMRYFINSASPYEEEQDILDSVFAGIPDSKKQYYDIAIPSDRAEFERFGLKFAPAVVIESFRDCSYRFTCYIQLGVEIQAGERWENKMAGCW